MTDAHVRWGMLGAAMLCAAGCDGGGGGGRTGAVVMFAYDAPTAADPDVAAAYPACTQGVGDTHIHPSWRDFRRYDLEAVGADLWIIEFADVPVGLRVSFRINDPNECANDPDGAVTTNISANGVVLTSVVSTPGANGTEPGLSFVVDAEGNVTP